MAPRKNTRVVLNRATFQQVTLGMADGLLALADAVIAAAKVPDAPVIGEGLVDAGGTVAYAFGKKVGGYAAKPRALKVKSLGVAIAGGFPFPAHLAEFGTINQPARPFLTPALMATVGDAEPYLRAAMKQRLATSGSRAAKSSSIKARIAAKAST